MNQPERFDGVLCAFVSVLVPLMAWPFAEVGFMDDFSYIRTAQVYSQTGHFVYNGWATAMLGWQIPWGALFIKLFGFSFTAPRLSTLVSMFLMIWLFHSVARRCGLDRGSAVFASLLLGLSPITVPLAFSFMTDISGMLALIGCLYACLRALDAKSDKAAFFWLIVAAVGNTVGGTARQVAWVGVLAIVPATAWYMRARRGALVLGGALWVLGAASIALIGRWLSHTPGYLAEELIPHIGIGIPHLAFALTHVAALALLCLAFLLLPLLAAWLPRIRLLSRPTQVVLAVVCLVYIALSVHQSHSAVPFEKFVMPWTWNILQDEIYSRLHMWMLSDRPIALVWPRILVSSAVVLALLSFAIDVIRSIRSRAAAQNGLRVFLDGASDLYKTPRLSLLAVYIIAYSGLLLPRFLHFFIVDRYLLGLLPPISILILRFYRDFISTRLPGISVAALVLLSCFALAGTHDLFAQYRANVRATSLLMQAGIPRTQIEGGEEFDGWTQIEMEGYLHDDRIQNVDPSFTVLHKDSSLPELCSFHFLAETPVVHPEYFTATENMPCLKASPFAEIPYRAWLPPFNRGVWTMRRP